MTRDWISRECWSPPAQTYLFQWRTLLYLYGTPGIDLKHEFATVELIINYAEYSVLGHSKKEDV